MKNLIIYKSNTGFTKEYATMLQRRIDGDLLDIKNLKKKTLKNYDNIFFGGPLRNNVILGLNKFLKHYDIIQNKNIFIFAVGIEPLTDDKKENVIASNGLDLYHVRLYFLQGGLDFSRMKFPQKQILRYALKVAGKKEGISEEMIKSRLENNVNMVNSSNLDYMVDVYRRVTIKH